MFKIVVPLEGRKAVQVDRDVPTFIGMKIGDQFDGSIIGLNGYKLQITGGSDRDGFPMRRDLPGTARKKVLLVGGIGCKPKGSGVRTTKTIRGNRIAEDIVQVNVKVVEKGPEPVEKLLGLEKPAEGEAPAGSKKPETPAEPKKTEPPAKDKEPGQNEESKAEKKPTEKNEPKKEEPAEEKPAKKSGEKTEEKEPNTEETKPEKKDTEKTEPEKKKD